MEYRESNSGLKVFLYLGMVTFPYYYVFIAMLSIKYKFNWKIKQWYFIEKTMIPLIKIFINALLHKLQIKQLFLCWTSFQLVAYNYTKFSNTPDLGLYCKPKPNCP